MGVRPPARPTSPLPCLRTFARWRASLILPGIAHTSSEPSFRRLDLSEEGGDEMWPREMRVGRDPPHEKSVYHLVPQPEGAPSTRRRGKGLDDWLSGKVVIGPGRRPTPAGHPGQQSMMEWDEAEQLFTRY